MDDFFQVFGASKVTPNMHMHLHLADILKEYGPFHSSWTFAFELFNGASSPGTTLTVKKLRNK